MTIDVTRAAGTTQALSITHVLVVDDQSAFRDLLKRMLEPAGYEVRTAADAHAALQSIAESRPAVAVLDIHMPGPNGLWLANQIRAHSPSTAIVLATSDDTVPPAESLRKGVVAYVLKPLRREAVLEAVADAFKWFAGESRLSLSQVPIPLHTHAPPHVEPDADAAPAGHARRRDRARRTSMRLLIPAALMAAAGLALYGRSTPANVVDLVAAASGQVTVEDAAGQPLTQGSGFFITPDTFVTSHHVVDGGSRATILMARSGLVLTVSGLLAFDREHDVALLKTAGQSAAWLELDVSPPSLGTPDRSRPPARSVRGRGPRPSTQCSSRASTSRATVSHAKYPARRDRATAASSRRRPDRWTAR